MATWLSTFRNGRPCEVVGDFCGSFNWTCKVRFEDDIQWMVRFAVPGKVMKGDEKVRREVATMQFIKMETSIPVPSVMAWGTSKENPLGLGAFIIMEFIEGEPLGKILEVLPEPESGQILRSDISDRDLDIIYRQIANILLELSEHDFSQIGSLSRIDNTHSCATSRPLTLKLNEIESHGGVFVGGMPTLTASPRLLLCLHSSPCRQCFEDILLYHRILPSHCPTGPTTSSRQPNSTDNIDDARSKYTHCGIFKAITSHFVSDKHDRGPFKLVCDDMRFGNMLVNNAKDLKIVAVLDWEWAYAAPYQMLYSPPRWLLIKKPIQWDVEDHPHVPYLSQIMSHFQKFVQILEEEESQRAGDVATTSRGERMSSLMRQSMDDGKFWFHELIHSSFESADNPAWAAIREIIPNLDELAAVTDAELNAFFEA